MTKKNTDFPWDIKDREKYGVHFGPYYDSRFKPTRRLMFKIGVPFIMKTVGSFFTSSQVSVIGKDIEDELISRKGGIIYAHWHRYASYYFMYACHKRHVIMSSHKDSGEIGARTMKSVGILTVRGAPKKKSLRSDTIKDKKGKEALTAMVGLIKNEGFHAGLTVDGPSGPAFVIKKGLIRLAKESGSPIIAMSVAAKPHFTLPSWDRMWIPTPRSKIIYIFTGPFYVPKDANNEKMEAIRVEIEGQMKMWAEKAQLYWKDAKLRKELGKPVNIKTVFSPKL